MKVLVTGGSGRAGKYVIKELTKNNHEVINGDIIPSDQFEENSNISSVVIPKGYDGLELQLYIKF